ncbi:MAG: sulfotransferase [Chitinophagaceae bacterium]|nr:MAG: sulfotransferase [Chitinophagaceae bacterium]
MTKKAFIPLSLIPLAGGSLKAIRKTIEGCEVSSQYKMRLYSAFLVGGISKPFRLAEDFVVNKKSKTITDPAQPLFILGHWRSGTTLLHNLLTQDPDFGYVTTYQSVFPNVTLSGKWLFKNFMQLAMPDKRPADNVKLSADFPQEEEFALGNIHGLSYYNFWYFPDEARNYFSKYLTFEDLNPAEKEYWKASYKQLVKTAILNTKRKNIVLKNPPNTGRIDTLLEIYPNAKFIHIMRNPVTVYLSTKRFFEKTMPALQLNKVEEKRFIENIFWVYEKLMDKYEKDKVLIPEGNLYEFKFEDFEKEPLTFLRKIYTELKIDNFHTAEPHFVNYLNSQKKFKMNKHKVDKESLDLIMQNMENYCQKYEYNVPDNIEIM